MSEKVHLKLRLPPELHAKLKAQALGADLSLNSLIVKKLELDFTVEEIVREVLSNLK